MSPRAARLAAGLAAIAALATAACGGEKPPAAAPAAKPAPAQYPLSSAEAAKRAQRIVLVISDGSRVVDDGRGTPFTRTRFEVQRVLKGSLPDEFAIQVIGGRLGNRIVSSPVPPFQRAHRYLLFLGPDGPDGPAGPTIFPDNVVELPR